MRVLVCGSRSWDDIHAIRMRLLRLPPSTTVVHGGAPGADRTAAWLAEDFGFSVEEHRADWNRYGKRAGILRNLRMLDEHIDLVIAFWDGRSRGTEHTIGEAERRGIPVEVHRGAQPEASTASPDATSDAPLRGAEEGTT